MPEAPDLEIIKDFLNRKVQGTVVKSAKVIPETEQQHRFLIGGALLR